MESSQQIVVEDAKAPDSVFPLDIFAPMIVVSGRATQESTLAVCGLHVEPSTICFPHCRYHSILSISFDLRSQRAPVPRRGKAAPAVRGEREH